MIDRLETIQRRYDDISAKLMDSSIINNVSLLKELSKEQSSLENVVLKYGQYKKILKSIDDLKSLLDDEEMKEIAKEEKLILEEQKKIAEQELEVMLLPTDPNDEKNVIVEIRGAAGGDEANIFAGDLFRMYQRYAEKQGWKLEVLNAEDCESGGYSQIEFMVKGTKVYSKLKYESGAHRVQRVPATESQGRIHTSTATVLVMPEAEDIEEVNIKENEIKIDVFHSGGAGGQSVNTTDSAVRITHIPTNIVVSCQNERSQLQNKEKAMQILKAKLYEKIQSERDMELGNERKGKIGTGDRSEKIRTYNYPQNRVTDHRINFTLNKLDRVIDGEVDEIIEALINEDQKRKIEGSNEN